MNLLQPRSLPPVATWVLRDLEFHRIQSAVAARAQTPMGRQRAESLPLLRTTTEVWDALCLRGELMNVSIEHGWPALGGVQDIEEAVHRADVGGILEPLSLMAVATTLSTGERAANWCVARRIEAPKLAASLDAYGNYADLVRAIDRSFEPSGRIADDASPTLRELRRFLASVQETLKVRMEALVREFDDKGLLQDRYHTLREDRYVLPVKAAERRRVEGIVHDTSQTHQTFFIEPQEVVDLGNRLKMAASDVEEEEQRILKSLSARVGARTQEILEDLHALIDLDVASSGARLGVDLRGAIPELSPPTEKGPGDVYLRGFRHPLLVLDTLASGPDITVPNDLKAGHPHVLIITGPNTGGKTVALKGVGLAALMVRAGLPLPAALDSRIPLYDHVYSVIGDQQSIAENLSSFAAHLLAVRRMLDGVREGQRQGLHSLCVLDEVMAGTDPDQGSALAQAVLEELAEAGAHVVVTTHYEKLKVLALDETGARVFRNASVGLHPDTGAPTYRLSYDAPGSSSAMEMAAKLMLDASIVERARTLAGQQGQTLETTLRVLANRQAIIDQERVLITEERARWERASHQVEMQAARLKERERELKREARESLLGEARRVRRELDDALNKARAALKRVEEQANRPQGEAQVDEARTAMDRVHKSVHHADRVTEQLARRQQEDVRREARKRTFAAPLQVGSKVFAMNMGVTGEVVELGPRDALIHAGALRLRVALADLAPPAPEVAREHAIPPAPASVRIAQQGNATLLHTLDLRGERVEDALERLEVFLDQAFGQDTGPLTVIHGHGSGALRKAVRQALKDSPYVQEFQRGPDDQGGEGITVVKLKDA